MKTLRLDASAWRCARDLASDIKQAAEHYGPGTGINALLDILVWDDDIEQPYRLIVQNLAVAPDEVREFWQELVGAVEVAKEQYPKRRGREFKGQFVVES